MQRKELGSDLITNKTEKGEMVEEESIRNYECRGFQDRNAVAAKNMLS